MRGELLFEQSIENKVMEHLKAEKTKKKELKRKHMLFICTGNLRGSLFASQSSSDSTGYEANGRSRDAYPNNTICKLGPTKFNITSFCPD